MPADVSSGWSPRDLRLVALKIGETVTSFLREYREQNSEMELIKGETFQADVLAESLALDELRNHGVRGLVVTEEKGVLSQGNDEIITILDPLDGTINYVSGIPWCAVSIAFALQTDEPGLEQVMAGAIFPVFYGKPISFAAGEGVFYGDKRMSRDEIEKNYSETGWKILAVYEDDPRAIENIRKVYTHLVSKIRTDGGTSLKIRSLGSAAMELGFVALGLIGYFVDLRARLRVVDVAAGLGAIREAGGSFVDSNGIPVRLRVDKISRLESVIAVTRKKDAHLIIEALR